MRISKNSWTLKKKKVILVSGTVRGAMLTIQIDKTLIFVFILVLLISISNMNVPNPLFCGNVSVGKQLARPLFESGSYITAQSNIAHL